MKNLHENKLFSMARPVLLKQDFIPQKVILYQSYTPFLSSHSIKTCSVFQTIHLAFKVIRTYRKFHFFILRNTKLFAIVLDFLILNLFISTYYKYCILRFTQQVLGITWSIYSKE